MLKYQFCYETQKGRKNNFFPFCVAQFKCCYLRCFVLYVTKMFYKIILIATNEFQ